MLHSLAQSQSMGKVSAGFKNAKSMTKMLSQTFPALDEDEAPLPLVTRETLAYAMTLGIWSVCFKSDDDMFKGRPEAFYEKALKDLQGLGDEQWDSLLKGLMLEYVGLVTSPQPPGITAPPLGAPDVVAKDAARAAARAAAGGGGGGGYADADAAGAGTPTPGARARARTTLQVQVKGPAMAKLRRLMKPSPSLRARRAAGRRRPQGVE